MLFIIPLYFGFAVVYDVYSTIHDIVMEHSISPGKVITQGVPTGIVKNTSALLNVTSATNSDFYNTTISSILSSHFSTNFSSFTNVSSTTTAMPML